MQVGLTPDRACKAPDSFKLSGRWGEVVAEPSATDPCIILATEVLAETLAHS